MTGPAAPSGCVRTLDLLGALSLIGEGDLMEGAQITTAVNVVEYLVSGAASIGI